MIVDKFELARVFDVSPETVRDWTRQGCPTTQEPQTGKGVAPEARKRLYSTSAIHLWLVQRAMNRRW